MNAAEVEVAVTVTVIAVADGCIALWAPLPWGLGLRRPRWTRHLWIYPRSTRARGLI